MNNLKAQLIWIPWINGNPGKKPSVDGKRYAKWSNPSILMKYESAINLQTKTLGLAGIGFVIPEGYIVIDLDSCFADNMPNTQAKELLKKFKSYAELSPSGKGIHIIIKSEIPCKKWTTRIDGQSVEFLTPRNFVTYTGKVLMDVEIRDCTDLIKEFQPSSPVSRPDRDLYATHIKGHLGRSGVKDNSSYGKAALAGECYKIWRATVGNRTNSFILIFFQ